MAFGVSIIAIVALMPSEFPTPPDTNELIIRPSTGLATNPNGGSLALSEIINRSLTHVQTSRALVVIDRRAGEEREFEIAPGVSIMMCWIPPGEFLMGSSTNELPRRRKDEKQHHVHITKGFWLAKTPTTQAQWEAVMGNNPSHFKAGNLPVEQVSWLDICGGESRTGGFLGAINRMASGGGRFDLPTEAQWEYAARAGSPESRYGDLDEIAWYWENSNEKTHPVGQKKPNAWGLYDMLGHVCEWCSDWAEEYSRYSVINPGGPTTGTMRISRGGFWNNIDYYCHFSFRHGGIPSKADKAVGFRISLNITP